MTGNPHKSLIVLLQAVRDYARLNAPDIAAFCGSALNEDHPISALTPSIHPATGQIKELADQVCPMTQAIFCAIITAIPHLHWKQSYTLDDPGFDQNHLDNYAWFNLIAPSGPFVSDEIRVSCGYWGKGLHYPVHWHEPEEIYLTVAGSARYISKGRTDVIGGPGATVCHYSNQPHAAEMRDAPLLALAFWRGKNLEAKSGLGVET